MWQGYFVVIDIGIVYYWTVEVRCRPLKDFNMKRIGLIDVDSSSKYPNLALMKISAWHKSQGDIVEWYYPFGDRYDIVYKSKVFSFTKDFTDAINADLVIGGGSGYCIDFVDGMEVFHKEKDIMLEPQIEHIYPDYSLYPKLTKDTAYGFLTRGCPRGCSFCIVGKKEGLRSVKWSDLSEFWKGQKKVVLHDPNILACKDWENLLGQLKDSNAEVDFNQGMDIRLMTIEKAEMLKSLKTREIHFAWDRYEDKDIILPKLKLYAEAGKKANPDHNSIVYTIVNFDTTLEQDLERIYTLRDMGYWPYVMIYSKYNCDHIYLDLQRWVNNRFIFASCKRFEDYKRGAQYNV